MDVKLMKMDELHPLWMAMNDDEWNSSMWMMKMIFIHGLEKYYGCSWMECIHDDARDGYVVHEVSDPYINCILTWRYKIWNTS
jgi:hypothetical protein